MDMMTDIAPLVDAHPGLCLAEAYVLRVLIDLKGRIATQEFLSARVWDMSGQRPTVEGLRTSIKRLRRLGIGIETLRGIGYRMPLAPPAF